MEQKAEKLASLAAPSRFDVRIWEAELHRTHYPTEQRNALLASLRFGASIDPAPLTLWLEATAAANHGSAYGHSEFVAKKLRSQLEANTLLVWDCIRLGQPLVVAPLGVVAKFALLQDELAYETWRRTNARSLSRMSQADFAGHAYHSSVSPPQAPHPEGKQTLRLIHDAKRQINARGEAAKLGKLDSLRSVARRLQPGDYMWTKDLSSAFKMVRVIPWQIPALAVRFAGATLVDTTLTFGLNTAPLQYAACVGDPLLWIVQAGIAEHNLLGFVSQYVDDHFGAAPTPSASARLEQIFLHVCTVLNIAIEHAKDQPMAQHAKHLGMELDTSTDRVLIICPEAKLEKIRHRLQQAIGKQYFPVKELESVCGSLAFIAVAIEGAQIFSAELRSALHAARASGKQHVPITAEMLIDMSFWSGFANSWNGREFIPSQPRMPAGHLTADAMSDPSISAIGVFVCGRAWRIVIDGTGWVEGADKDISILETLAYAALCLVSAAVFPDSKLQLLLSWLTDNTTVKGRVTLGYARPKGKNSRHANRILRFIQRVMTVARIGGELDWTDSGSNTLSDAPSRDDQAAFQQALSFYNANTLPNSQPEWWPRGFQFRPEGRPFTTCNQGSSLYSAIHNLGAEDASNVPVSDDQVAHLLQQIRAELTITVSGGY
jgi:hypothetical protein